MYRTFIVLFALGALLVLPGAVSAAGLTVLTGQEITINDTQTYTTLDVVGGTLIIDPGAVLTFEARSIIDGEGSTVIMNGGTCHVLGDGEFERLTIGGDSHATFIQNGGYFRVGDESSPDDAGDTKLGDNPGEDRYMHLNGGVFRTHRMEVDGGGDDLGERGSNIIIGGGTLIIEDTSEGGPDDWITVDVNDGSGNKILRPAEGYIGLIITDYNATGKMVTAILGPGATNPSPEDDGENACPEALLTWSAGPNTQPTNGHEVYFGTDANDVNDATTSDGLGVYEGAQDGTSFDPDPDLAMNSTYYWRVDQVNTAEAWTPRKGTVWSFTTNDGNAFDPDPEDDEIKVPLDKVLGWTSGCGVGVLHDVYFSTDFDEVDSMNTNARVENDYAGTTYDDPCDFDYLVDYYWRVVEDDTYIGPVWHFQAKSAVIDPNMKLWYEFNETDGNTVADSSGYQNHGDMNGFYEGVWDQVDSSDGGGSINMDGE
ncbi:MAG: hypothetical protein ACYSWP_11750, partial [Planctomycetota bacterium]